MKECKTCGVERPLDDFHIHTKGKPYRRSDCKECWAWKVKSKAYDISREAYQNLFASQKGKCAICGALFSAGKRQRKLSIDHDHRTGAIRGLLCSNCNTGLGLFKDSLHRLEAAKQYLVNNGKDIV